MTKWEKLGYGHFNNVKETMQTEQKPICQEGSIYKAW